MKLKTTKFILGVSLFYGFLMAHNSIASDPTVPSWVKLMPAILGLFILLIGTRRSLLQTRLNLMKNLLSFVGNAMLWLFYGRDRWQGGARWMDIWDRLAIFRLSNKGFLLDGKKLQLSLKDSFRSMLVVGGPGTGKTSSFIIPNAFTLRQNSSLVLFDTSGEVYSNCATALKNDGYDLLIFNLISPSRSHCYNPLQSVNTFSEISKLADTLIDTTQNPNSNSDAFWGQGAKTIVRCFIQAMKNADEPDNCTLGHLKRHLDDFDYFTKGAEGKTAQFILDNSLDDPHLWSSFKGFVSGPEKSVMGQVATANTALTALGNPELDALTSVNEINFQKLRKGKTALFVKVRQQDIESLQFILSAFLTDCFHSLMKDYRLKLRPIWVLLEEAGNVQVNGLPNILATCRKYNIGCQLILQSLEQLERFYGKSGAQTIRDSVGTKVFMSALGLNTAEQLSRQMGRKRPKNYKKINRGDEWLMTPDEIITLKNNQALVFHTNKRVAKIKLRPFYKHPKFRRLAALAAVELPHTTSQRANSATKGVNETTSEEESNQEEHNHDENSFVGS